MKVFVLILFIVNVVQSAKILVVFPVPARSHYNLGSALARGLAERGHDVTMISPFHEKDPPKNGSYRDIVLNNVVKMIESRRNESNAFDFGSSNPFAAFTIVALTMEQLNTLFFEEPAVVELLKSNDKFDAVIVEQFFNDGLKTLSVHFDAPLILFSTIGANSWFNPLVGNPTPISYIPEIFQTYSSQMTFWERLTNALFRVYTQTFFHLYFYPNQNRVVQKYLNQDLYKALYNTSLCLLNSHPSTNQPVPYVPNMIDIGGFHVRPPKQLPKDLQTFLDNAKDGVIYFSMGSNLKSADLPLEKRDAILSVFSKLKQKIIWKFEDDNLPGKPDNLKIGKWLPQQDILAHKNVKLFITHGGLLSTTETVYHGVSILAIPVYGDQMLNAKMAVDNGIGLMLNYADLNEKNFDEKLQELLKNPKYNEMAKQRSKIFHDRQNKPLDTAVFWVEYVIRQKGAPHLRVAALDLPWYKYHLLDVIAFLAVLLLLISYVILVTLRRICRKFCRCQNVTEKTKVKKQ